MPSRTKYTKELLQTAALQSQSIAGVLRYLNLKQAGGTQSYLSRRLTEYQIDINHFTGCAHNRGKASYNKKSASDILISHPEGAFRPKRVHLVRALLEIGIPETCQTCGLGPH